MLHSVMIVQISTYLYLNIADGYLSVMPATLLLLKLGGFFVQNVAMVAPYVR